MKIVYICSWEYTISMISGTKINQLLQKIPDGTVVLSSWLEEQGYSPALQQSYRKSGWFTSIGNNAMIRSGQKLQLNGAIYALQHQAGVKIHIGGRSAFNMLGLAHFLELNPVKTTLFAGHGIKLPAWILKNKWNTRPELVISSMLPEDAGLEDFQQKEYTLKISGSTRAMMECLYLSPNRFDLSEAAELMDGLNNLNPTKVQELLGKCKSVKVKRLFMFLAERAGHSWLNHIDKNKIDLGRGKRSIVPGGIFVSTYMTTLPPDLVNGQ